MRTRIWRYIRHNLIAVLALFIALGGTSYAATRLPANSVGTRQIVDNAVTLHKIDLAARRALHGAIGPKGHIGSPGKDGMDAATSVIVRTGSSGSFSSGNLGAAEADCNPGEHATGGGEFVSPTSGGVDELIRISAPMLQGGDFPGPASAGDSPNAWYVETLNTSGTDKTLYAYVVCVSP